jgi:hypothetical protein
VSQYNNMKWFVVRRWSSDYAPNFGTKAAAHSLKRWQKNGRSGITMCGQDADWQKSGVGCTDADVDRINITFREGRKGASVKISTLYVIYFEKPTRITGLLLANVARNLQFACVLMRHLIYAERKTNCCLAGCISEAEISAWEHGSLKSSLMAPPV